jgi:hypothetical protein
LNDGPEIPEVGTKSAQHQTQSSCCDAAGMDNTPLPESFKQSENTESCSPFHF